MQQTCVESNEVWNLTSSVCEGSQGTGLLDFKSSGWESIVKVIKFAPKLI